MGGQYEVSILKHLKIYHSRHRHRNGCNNADDYGVTMILVLWINTGYLIQYICTQKQHHQQYSSTHIMVFLPVASSNSSKLPVRPMSCFNLTLIIPGSNLSRSVTAFLALPPQLMNVEKWNEILRKLGDNSLYAAKFRVIKIEKRIEERLTLFAIQME